MDAGLNGGAGAHRLRAHPDVLVYSEAYLRLGLALTPLRAASKEAYERGWNRRDNAIVGPAQVERLRGCNVGILLRWSGLCTIDIDDYERACPWFAKHGIDLPSLLALPDAVRTVTGKPGHEKLWFRLPPGVEYLPSLRLGDGAVELRCGREDSSDQDMAPPSIHPDTGQPVHWQGDYGAIPVLPSELLALWQQQAAAKRNDRNGETSEKIAQGQRHNTLVSRAGTLRRKGLEPEAIEADLLAYNAQHCEPPLPEHEVSQIARSSKGWEAGSQPVAERFDTVAQFERYLGGRYLHVAQQGSYYDLQAHDLLKADVLIDKEQSRAPWPVGQKAPFNLSRVALRNLPSLQRVDRLEYRPGFPVQFDEDGAAVWNRWRPHLVTPLEATAEELALWNEFLDHLFPDDEGRAFYARVEQRFAALVQRPYERARVGTLLIGTQGIGKSTLFDVAPRLLVGERNVGSATAGVLQSQFNDYSLIQVLTLPELHMGDRTSSRKLGDSLKPLITDDLLHVNPKGRKSYQQPNVATVLATTNHLDAAFLDFDDRRWDVYEPRANEMPEGLQKRLYAFLKGPRGAGVLHGLFRAVDLSGYQAHAHAPHSASKERATEAGQDEVRVELREAYQLRQGPFERKVFTLKACRAYLELQGIDTGRPGTKWVAHAVSGAPMRAQPVGRTRVDGQYVRLWAARRDEPEKLARLSEGQLRELLGPQRWAEV